MAAKSLDPAIAEVIVRDWRIGKLSIRDLADKHGVSRGKVGELCKGVPKDAAVIVDAGVQYRQALSVHDGRMVDAIEQEVEERTKHIQFFTNAAVTNVKQAMNDVCDGQADYQRRADTINKGREAVLGKTPETAIQINTGAPLPDMRPQLTKDEWMQAMRPNAVQ